MRAYGQGETEDTVRERLKAISIRSPYRDLRQALAALLKLETDPAGALALIERIPPTSPYQDLVELVRVVAAAGTGSDQQQGPHGPDQRSSGPRPQVDAG